MLNRLGGSESTSGVTWVPLSLAFPVDGDLRASILRDRLDPTDCVSWSAGVEENEFVELEDIDSSLSGRILNEVAEETSGDTPVPIEGCEIRSGVDTESISLFSFSLSASATSSIRGSVAITSLSSSSINVPKLVAWLAILVEAIKPSIPRPFKPQAPSGAADPVAAEMSEK